MSSIRILASLLAVLALPCLYAFDEDLSFENSDEVEFKISPDVINHQWNNKATSVIGRAFHMTIPKENFGRNVHSFEAKKQGGRLLPPWLLFDKTDGIFWGVPLMNDVGTLHVTVKSVGTEQTVSHEFEISIVEPNEEPEVLGKCPENEDNTVLTFLIDKGVHAIKPKQRVVAINNIAKFLGIPYSAFTFKTESRPDDINDSSVILAGPGNLKTRTSKSTTLLEVLVGCDGRLWLSTAPLVHQLKQQARDGTITEVLGLPIIGWRVKTETRPIIRFKRQTGDESYGSGDYDYYEDYEYEDEENDDLPTTAQATTTSATTTTTTTTTTASTPPMSSTHHHRHHHGENKLNETEFSIPVHRPFQTSSRVLDTEDGLVTKPLLPEIGPTVPAIPSTVSTTVSTTTEAPTQPPMEPSPLPTEKSVPTTTSTTTTTTTVTSTTRPAPEVVPEGTTHKANPDEAYDFYDEYDNNDNYDDGDVESETVVPKVTEPKITISQTNEEPESRTTEAPVPKTTIKEATEITTIAASPTPNAESTLFFFDNEDNEEDGEETHFNAITDEPSTLPTQQPTTISTTTVPFTTTITTLATSPSTSSTTPPTTTSTTTTTTTTTTTEKPTTLTEETTTEDRSTTTVKVTTLRHVTSTPRTTTSTQREITESIEYDMKNFPPYIETRLQQMSVTAGKLFRFVIPKNTFKDFEDKFNLTVEVLDYNGQPLGKSSWLQYKSVAREVYGLPLENDVSKWEYIVRATDTGGKYCEDTLKIQVQQHKSHRAVNHEFSLQIRIEKHSEFPYYIDWCMHVLRALGRVYRTDGSEITVRHINYTSDDPVVFTWTNDSVPKKYCPSAEIQRLYKVLTANDVGDPSRELSIALAPEMRVKKVTYTGLGVCEVPQPAVPTPPKNYAPVIRNHVDIIKGTVGELLIFRVPEDTFYDPEETDSRLLNVTLLTANRQLIPVNNWLQFDTKNREFYGIPWKNATTEYQLVCFDRAGLSATDSLVVEINYPPRVHHNVEFSMVIETPHHTFNNSVMQRKFVENLAELFGDYTTDHIRMLPFKPKSQSTIATWFNTSLVRDECPHEEISQLETLVKNHDRSIKARVHQIMEFNISLIQIIPHGKCKILQKPKVPKVRPEIVEIEEPPMPVDESTPPQASSDEYLITFIVPAIIISIMLFLAAIAACILYRKRRSGKMNLEEDGRQSYGNKGIPVIFQEELEEKPEAGTKTPVILKDEKPPLAPPEYSKSGSLKLKDDSEPYQPPPPFTRTQDNNRQSRPKPTPTYRKPPPYVPP